MRLLGIAVCFGIVTTVLPIQAQDVVNSSSPPFVSTKSPLPGIIAPVLDDYKHQASPTYPPEARRAGEEGWVHVVLTVREDGTVRDPYVAGSSGFPDLDAAAIETVKQWRFRPALKDGGPVEVRTEVGVRFQLQEDNNAPPSPYTVLNMTAADYPSIALQEKQEGKTYVAVRVFKDGTFSAGLAKSSGSKYLDQAALADVMGRLHFTPATLQGKPIESTTLVILNWQLPSSPSSGKR